MELDEGEGDRGQGGWSRRRRGGDRMDGARGGGRGQVTVDPEVDIGSFLSF